MVLSKDEQIVYDLFCSQQQKELFSEMSEDEIERVCETLISKGYMKKSQANIIGDGCIKKYKPIII